jgi:hypothetical protein
MDHSGSKKAQDCSQELWEIFEKTGSIAAYILYSDMKKKSGKKEEGSEDRVTK